MRASLLFLCLLITVLSKAGAVSGVVRDNNGAVLSFSSISVKGSNKGAVANADGYYSLNLDPGSYTLVCQHIGFRPQETKVTVDQNSIRVNFQLALQELAMSEVVIKRGPDPAIEIIRETIRKREFYNRQVDSFTADVYVKGLMRTRSMPEQFMGKKVEREPEDGLDSAGKGIVYLSESLTKVAYARPDKYKYEVLSSRQSGGGYGISIPFFVNFYTNNVSLFSGGLNPRGFISPISDNAFHYYQFRFEGNFFEGDKMIDRIRVRPKRRNEPLFDGYLQIIDGEWRLHGLELAVTQQYGLEFLDTVRVTQLHAPVTPEVWRTNNQVLYLSANIFGFDITGNFLNVYSNYDIDPQFRKNYFDRILMRYDTAANRRDSAYWSAVRAVPLEEEERRDFAFKDSVRKRDLDSLRSRRRDSVRTRAKPVTLKGVLLKGFDRNFRGRAATAATYHFSPLVKELEYNTVEGLAVSVVQSLTVKPWKKRREVSLLTDLRYGISNRHFNAFGILTVKSRQALFRDRYLQLGGGKRIAQFNPDNPIDPLTNSIYTLLSHRNYMKLYENRFVSAAYNNRMESGLRLHFAAQFEDRIPVENTSDFSLGKKGRPFLPNHPFELANIPFDHHQAFVAAATVSYQPGQSYIQYPHEKVPVGSKYPTFELHYAKGIKGIFGSDADFDKWKFSIYDDVNLKLGGTFRYRLIAGGFLNRRRVDIPDFQHFNGNQTFFNTKYLNSFQLAPYYRYSNTEKLYGVAHVEHHFNGLLTNKLPLLKWNLVAGANTFYVNRNNHYVEVFAGLENIFKIFRLDFVTAYQSGPANNFGLRLGFGGILGGAIKVEE